MSSKPRTSKVHQQVSLPASDMQFVVKQLSHSPSVPLNHFLPALYNLLPEFILTSLFNPPHRFVSPLFGALHPYPPPSLIPSSHPRLPSTVSPRSLFSTSFYLALTQLLFFSHCPCEILLFLNILLSLPISAPNPQALPAFSLCHPIPPLGTPPFFWQLKHRSDQDLM